MPEAAFVERYATRSAILAFQTGIESVLNPKGDSGFTVPGFSHFCKQAGGSVLPTAALQPGRSISSQFTAQRLDIKTGDSLLVFSFLPDGSKNQAPDRCRPTSKTGIDEIRQNFAISDMAMIRRLNNWQTRTDRVQVALKTTGWSSWPKNIQWASQNWCSQSYPGIYPNIFHWPNLQGNSNTLLGICRHHRGGQPHYPPRHAGAGKTGMTGILKALGARSWTIKQIFLY